MSYDPPRQKEPVPTGDPLEIDLVFNLTRCGTCSFFWPDQPSRQPYGPYPAFDFDSNTPKATSSEGDQTSYAWLKARTRPPSFPDPEIMDGCRKAPIMTIGINPNLTAFAPGRMGAAWCYPNFSSVGDTDVWTKYAYYYRYRSIYQERFDLSFISRYLVKDGQIAAPKAGIVLNAERPSDSPSFDVSVHYDGDSADTTIRVEERLGEPRYVLLFDADPPDNRFSKGDVIAARLDVPSGEEVEVFRQQISYYEQFVPVLQRFENFLASQGHQGANLRVGEDVCQLDMVACASPHWSPLFLGGTKETESAIVHNCVAKNAWAIKQFVQTRPAVLFLVGESSYNMFRASFGNLIHPLPTEGPPDGAFTLLQETSDSKRPCFIQFSTTLDGEKYSISTRLVVTPHFSYNASFLPQFRMSNDDWRRFSEKFRRCAQFLSTDKRINYVAAQGGTYAAYQIERDPSGVLDELRREYLDALGDLNRGFCDAHRTMAGVLEDLCSQGALSYTPAVGSKPGHLTRTDGSCQFCVNQHWKFPQGCPYEKTEEQAPPVGFLNKVAEAMVSAGALTR